MISRGGTRQVELAARPLPIPYNSGEIDDRIICESTSPGGTRYLRSGGGTRHAVSPGGTRYLLSAGGRKYSESPGGTRYLAVLSPGGTRYLESPGGTRNLQEHGGNWPEALSSRAKLSAPRASPNIEVQVDEEHAAISGRVAFPESSSRARGKIKYKGKFTSVGKSTSVKSKPFDSTFKTAQEKDLEPSKHIETIARIHSQLPVTMLYEETYREELCEPGEVFYKLPQVERCALGMQMPLLSKMVLAIHLIKYSNFPYGICSYEISSRLVTLKLLHGTNTHTLFRAFFSDIITEELAQIDGCIQVIKKSKPAMRVIMLRDTWDKVSTRIRELHDPGPAGSVQGQVVDLLLEKWGNHHDDGEPNPSVTDNQVASPHTGDNVHPVRSITQMMFQDLAPPPPMPPQVFFLFSVGQNLNTSSACSHTSNAVVNLSNPSISSFLEVVLHVYQVAHIDTSPRLTTWDELWGDSTSILQRFLQQEDLDPAEAERVATAFSRQVSDIWTLPIVMYLTDDPDTRGRMIHGSCKFCSHRIIFSGHLWRFPVLSLLSRGRASRCLWAL